jgi:hypothetical protein
MQKKIQALVFIAMLAILVTSCKSSKHNKSKRLPGVWQAQPITIDGSNKDWPSPYPEYDDKAQLGYAVSNDKENLYITVETGDPATQLKILRQGLTVWIDKTGEKEEQTAINFPIPSQATEEPKPKREKPTSGQFQQGNGSTQDKKRMELEDRVKAAMADANEYSLQGFKSCNLQFPIMENDSCGIKVRMAIDADNELVWEAVVPLKSFYPKHEITRVDKGKPISICFETVAMKRPANEDRGGHGGGGNGGGMRPGVGMGGMGMGMRMGGGGSHGGNRGGAQQPSIMEPAYKSTITWKKFGLGWPN